MKNTIMKNTKCIILVRTITVLTLSVLATEVYAAPSCQIITEIFSSFSYGIETDNHSVGWYINTYAIPDALYFAMKSHRFHAEELEGEGIWYSDVFNVPGYPNFQMGVKIVEEGGLSGSEYVKLYYKLDGGTETLLDERTGNFGTIDFQSPLLNANTVQIVVKLDNYDKRIYAKSVYYIVEYLLFSDVPSCSVQVNPEAYGSITCANSSVKLSAGANITSNVTYQWSGPQYFVSDEQHPATSIPGNYSVTAIDPANGCISKKQVTVFKKNVNI